LAAKSASIAGCSLYEAIDSRCSASSLSSSTAVNALVLLAICRRLPVRTGFEPPSRVVLLQGSHVGRPSRLTVDIPQLGGIVVRGEAVEII